MPTMYTTTYTDVYSGNLVSPAFSQYTGFNLIANTVLSWPTDFQNLNMVVSVNMDITPSAGGFTVTMPDATKIGTGFAFTINNPGGYDFNLLDSTGALIVTIQLGTSRRIWLISNTTAAGTWRTFTTGGGSAVTSVNAISASDNLVITGVPIINTGTINFALAKDLAALSGFAGSIGIPFRTAANTWSLGQILGKDNQIAVANPSGATGNPTISLIPDIKGLTSIEVGNLSLSVNTIASRNTNGAIILAPNGAGVIQLVGETDILAGNILKFFTPSGLNYISFQAGAALVNQSLILPTTAPVSGQVLGYSGSNQLAWASVASFPGVGTANAFPRYSLSGGSFINSVIVCDDTGNITGTNSMIVNQIQIGKGSINPGQTISTQGAGLDLIFEPNGVGDSIFYSDVVIQKNLLGQNALKLYNGSGNVYSGFQAAPLMTGANILWTLPLTGATAGYFTTDASNVMSIKTFPIPSTSVVNIVPKFTDTIGTLGASLLSIDVTGVATGLTSLVIGNSTITSGAMNVIGTYSVSATNNISFNNAGVLILGGASNATISLGGNNASTVNVGGATNTGITLTTGATMSLSATTSASLATPTFTLSTATASTSPTTGALVTAGGIGIALKAYIGGNTVIGPVSSVNTEQMLTLRGPTASINSGPHISTYVAADIYPVFQMFTMNHNDITMFFDAYYDGSNRSSGAAATTSFQMKKNNNQLLFGCMTSLGAGVASTWNTAGYIDNGGQLNWNNNISIGTTSFGGGVGVIAMLNATGIPAGATANTGILFVQAGALKYKGSAGTITTIAAA